MNNPEPTSDSRILARRALDQAASELERALYNMGFKAGWEAAVKRLTDASPSDVPEAPKLARLDHDDSPARKIVFKFIQENPGHRGSEIVQALRDTAGVKGNTTRTAIYRLKEADEIRNEDGKWFLKEAVNGHHFLESEKGG
jgi:hypothetical protein